jgi:hypothetical protein
MANSYVQYTGTGAQTAYSVNFPYISQSHVKVYVAGVLVTNYTWTNSSQITFAVAPANGVSVLIRRVTPSSPLVDFTAKSRWQTSDLNLSTRQALYLAEEASNADLVDDVLALVGTATTSATSASASASAAAASAASAIAVAVRDIKDLATLLADTSLTYTTGLSGSVVTGDPIRARTEGFAYTVAASGASNHHITTAGGVKLYVQPGQSGYNVKAFGAKADGSNDSAAIQKAIGTGGTVRFPAGSYYAALLTQSTSGQRIYADGQVNIYKNANGTLLTATGSYLELANIQFVGTGFTGDNIDCSGDHPRLIMCSSYGTPGVAARLRGAHVQIIGTCGSYSTTDATATGYDIVIGTDGVATLYHQLVGVYTSQATGGIKFIDTGAVVVTGGQFGKLTTVQGGGGYVSGCNTGQYIGCRVVGNVSIGQSNGAFSACEFAGASITVGSGLTGVNFDPSCVLSSGTTLTNTNNFNNIVLRNAFDGAAPSVHKLGVGGTTSLAWLGFEPSTGTLYTPAGMWIGYSANALLNLGGTSSYGSVTAGTGGLYLGADGSSKMQLAGQQFRPNTDNFIQLGSASQRYSVVYAATATINTSDRNQKQQIASLSDTEKAVGVALRGLVRKFKFNDAVTAKGDAARIHVGVIAQDVEDVFIAHGLDPTHYGIFCRDTWEAEDEVVDNEGNVIRPAKQAGTRLGVRYDELFSFIISVL